jgi:pimeloyl-ACP methyl ester carboxylesterase
MSGEDDPVIPLVNGRILARLIRRSRLHVVRDNGHLFLVTDAADSSRVVSEFLASPGTVSEEKCRRAA